MEQRAEGHALHSLHRFHHNSYSRTWTQDHVKGKIPNFSVCFPPACLLKLLAKYLSSASPKAPGKSHVDSWKVLWTSVISAQSWALQLLISTKGLARSVPRGPPFHVLKGWSCKVLKEISLCAVTELRPLYILCSHEGLPPACDHVTLSPGHQG